MKGPTSHAWLFAVIAVAVYIQEVISTPSPTTTTTSAITPNVILFVVDDMEWLDQFKDIAPTKLDPDGNTVELPAYPTAHISSFQNEAVVFPKSYCGGPKCAPSRYSMLTGRQPSRSKAAIIDTLSAGNGAEGTEVTVSNTKLSGDVDSVYNLPRVLQENGYYTGVVGKWHLMTPDDNGENLDPGCSGLTGTADADLYEDCTSIVKAQGFDFVDGFFYTNIPTNDDFNHNPEWMVSSAQKFITEAYAENKPFFLYFASTLTHSAGDVFTALKSFENTATPKGTLSGNKVPDDTLMPTRDEIWQMALTAGFGETFPVKKLYARYFWMDAQFGALIDYLDYTGVYDETMVILQSDHGMGAKGTMYEQGSRILNFVRYPPLFGTTKVVLSDDVVVSNVDLAATIFDLAGVTVPDDYTMDGTSWLPRVAATILDLAGVTVPYDYTMDGCCEYRIIDIFNSRSIVSAHYQYIWRANENVETNNNVDDLYPNTLDRQQLYDLDVDPNQEVNLIFNLNNDDMLADHITMFQNMMRAYIGDTCPAADGVCSLPPFDVGSPSDPDAGDVDDGFCSEIIETLTYRFFGYPVLDDATKLEILEKAEAKLAVDDPDCAVQEYWYLMTKYQTNKVRMEMDICCGADGAVFPVDYAPPNEYIKST